MIGVITLHKSVHSCEFAGYSLGNYGFDTLTAVGVFGKLDIHQP